MEKPSPATTMLPDPSPISPDLMHEDQVAFALGVTKQELRNMTKYGSLPKPIKAGQVFLYHKKDLADFFDGKRKPQTAAR